MTGPLQIELRTVLLAAAALLGALLVLLGPGAASGQAAQCTNSSTPGYQLSGKEARKATLCLLNRERNKRGMGDLRADDKQQKAAGAHNRVMLKKNCFSHQCSGEPDLVKRIEQAGYLPCSCSCRAGSRLARSA